MGYAATDQMAVIEHEQPIERHMRAALPRIVADRVMAVPTTAVVKNKANHRKAMEAFLLDELRQLASNAVNDQDYMVNARIKARQTLKAKYHDCPLT